MYTWRIRGSHVHFLCERSHVHCLKAPYTGSLRPHTSSSLRCMREESRPLPISAIYSMYTWKSADKQWT